MKFGFRVFRTYSYTLLYLLQHAQQQLYFWLPRKSYRFMITVSLWQNLKSARQISARRNHTFRLHLFWRDVFVCVFVTDVRFVDILLKRHICFGRLFAQQKYWIVCT